MIDNETRRLLAELGREQDRLLHEHKQWTAQREAECEAPMRESESEGILYREQQNNEPAAAAESSGLGFFGDERDDMLARAIGFEISELRRERRAAIAALKREIAEDLDSRDGKLMHMITRFAFSAERAEEETYQLINRVTRMEQLVRKHLAGEQAAVVDLPDRRGRRDVA